MSFPCRNRAWPVSRRGSLAAALFTFTIAVLSASAVYAAADDVLTQHNDAARTGAQLHETALNPSNIKANSFGRLYERSVNGQIIAQPLYAGGVTIPGKGSKNVVYVVTRANVVYAFDADDLDPDPSHGLLWSQTVEPAGTPVMCHESQGPLGVTSTPVIDRATGTMYVVARNADGSIWLHAIDITTGAPKSGTPGRVKIAASQSGLVFDQHLELNRAGLLLENGAVMLGFSALNCDNAGWHGWLLAYRTSDLAQIGTFVTTPSAGGWGGGIWASGKGLVGDGAGNVYFETGNGSVNGSDVGQSFVKLRLGPAPGYGLSLAGKYAVSNWSALNNGDTDLGSSGPLLAPGGRLIGGGKQGKLYVLNSQTMQPSQNGPSPSPVPPGGSDGFDAFVNTWHDDSSQRTCMSGAITRSQCFMPHPRYEESELAGPNIHSGPIYWNGKIYSMPEKDFIRAFDYNASTGTLAATPAVKSTVRAPDGMPGAAIIASSNGSSDGVIWASLPKVDGQWQNVPGMLLAFDASTLKELWRDDDDIAFAKFTPPMVAGGKVFRPTFANELIVYGLKSGPTQASCYNIQQVYENYTGPNGILGAATGVEAPLPDGIGRKQDYAGGSIYWTAPLCAHEVDGAIVDEYGAAGKSQGFLGYPITDEMTTPDGLGEYNHFQLGSIYWTPTTGAHEVHGAIRDKWSSLGWERSALGYPVSDETDEVNGSGRFNLFQHGSIHWVKSSGAVTVNVDLPTLLGPQLGGTDQPGGDIANFNLPAPNPTMCEERCQNDATCKAWTYVAPNTSQGPAPHCWLKNAIPVASANNCCTSGLKVTIHPPGFTEMQGAVDRAGGDFASFDLSVAEPLLCQGECAGNNACVAWAYMQNFGNPGRPHCWLKNSSPAAAANLQVTSGSKSPPPMIGDIWEFTGAPCNGDNCGGWSRLDDNPKTSAIVAGDSGLYQLHNDGWIWRYTGTPCDGDNCPGWQRLDDNAKTVAIVAGSDLYQLHNDGWIWRYTGTPCTGDNCPGWQRLDDNAKSVAIAVAGNDLYQLHNDGWIWRYTGTPCDGDNCPGWARIDDNAKTVAIAAAGNELYQLHNDGWIWRYTGTPCNGDNCPGWQRLDDNAKTVAIAAAGANLYQLHNDGWIWRYTGTPCTGDNCPGWVRLDDNAKTVAIAAAGANLYQLHNDGWIWRYTGTPCNGDNCPGWVRLDDNSLTSSIAAGGAGLFQLHSDPLLQRQSLGWIWRYTGPVCSDSGCPGWQRLDDNTATTGLAAAGRDIYQLHANGEIWRSLGEPCNGDNCPSWQRLDRNAAATAIAASGRELYQLHNSGEIWRSLGEPCNGDNCPSWQRLDRNAAATAIAASGRELYQLHNSGEIWRSLGEPCNGDNCPSWQRLDRNPATVAITAAGREVYQLHNNGEIWRSLGEPCNGDNCSSWQMLDQNPAATAIVAAGRDLYQLHNNGEIWRYTGVPCNNGSCPGWERLDDNSATVSISASGRELYQLHNDGEVWRSTGAPCVGANCLGWTRVDDNTKTQIISTGGEK
jgi:hypothetical protein